MKMGAGGLVGLQVPWGCGCCTAGVGAAPQRWVLWVLLPLSGFPRAVSLQDCGSCSPELGPPGLWVPQEHGCCGSPRAVGAVGPRPLSAPQHLQASLVPQPERIDPPDPTKPDYDIRADVWSLGISLVSCAPTVSPTPPWVPTVSPTRPRLPTVSTACPWVPNMSLAHFQVPHHIPSVSPACPWVLTMSPARP